jgi:hypothetical protein
VKLPWDWLPRLRFWPRGRGGQGTTRDHPSVEMLAAYHEDQLPPETEKEIQEHFVDCEECPELMLDLDRFTSKAALEAARDEISDTWVEAAWRRLRARLAVEARPSRALRWFRSPLLAWSLTVLLTPCAVSLWLRLGDLLEQMRGLETPQLNPPSWTVAPASTVRSAEPPPPDLEVPAGANRFLLILQSTDLSEHPEYRLEIRNGRGESLWKERGLHKNREGAFVVTLSRRFLPAGAYLFRVTGIAGGEDVPLVEEFPLRLRYR